MGGKKNAKCLLASTAGQGMLTALSLKVICQEKLAKANTVQAKEALRK